MNTKDIKFSDFLDEDNILCIQEPLQSVEVIELLVKKMSKEDDALDATALTAAVLEREAAGTTVIAPGIALPHARLEKLDELRAMVAISEEGFDFGEDEEPVNIAIVILTPKSDPGYYLRIVAAVSRTLGDEELRDKLAKCKTPAAAFALLANAQDELPAYLRAANIMSDRNPALQESDTLAAAISAFCTQRIFDISVIDEEGDLRGVVSLEDIMRLSLPEHLLWMEDLSSIINFQPFAELLRTDTETKLADFMSEDYCFVSPDTPAIQVARMFLMEGVRQIYVLEGRHLRGVIDIQDFISKLFWA